MDLSRTVVLSGIIGAIVAAGLIAATVYALPGYVTSVSTTTQTTTVSSSTERHGPNGTLSTLITDPPTVPVGTNDVYMSYSSIAIHIAGQGNSSQNWFSIGGPGTIDLMQSINISQTIGIASIPSGIEFDVIEFNVSQVTVTFNGVNYSASLISSQVNLAETLPGGVTVGAAQTQAVLIDMSPKIILLGDSSLPAFAFLPSARAFIIPTNDIPAQAHVLGGRSNLAQNLWWKAVALMTHFEITSISLLPNFLQINVTNTGNTSVTFKLVTITPTDNTTYGPSIPALVSSAVFSVTANATLVPISGSNKSQILDELASDGYVLSAHATVTFTFSNYIETGLIQFGNASPASTILTAQPYTVRLFGNDNVAYADITV